MAVKLELYRVFKEVAETGNISAAAKNLYISQSAVSQSIKQLETALQARLFARSPRGVTLTGEGQMLYQYVRNALGLLATGEDKLSQAQQLLLGTLTIGASDTVTGQFLTPYLDEFHHQHPGIRLKIVSGRSAKVVSMLRSGAVDIAFASSPKDSTLETWPCFATHSVFVAGKNYHCDFDKIYTRQEMAEFPLILLERKASSRVFLEQEFLKAGVTLTPEIELSSRQLLVTLAGIGLGVAGVTLEFVRKDLESGDIRLLKTDFTIPERSVDMCTLKEVPPTAAATAFMEMVRRDMRDMETFLFLFEMLGTIAFAASGAVLGVRKGLDVFGVCILGLTTACGGGMVRDVLLGNTPPAAFQNPTASAVAVVTSLTMFLSGVRHLLMGNQRRYDLFMLLMDSAGLGIFTVMGVRVVWNCVEAPSLYLLVFVGVLTGVGGGLLRDVMAGDMPYIFVKHIYACASLVGAVICGVLRQSAGEMTAMLVGAAAVFAIRCLSAHYRWNLPHPNA